MALALLSGQRGIHFYFIIHLSLNFKLIYIQVLNIRIILLKEYNLNSLRTFIMLSAATVMYTLARPVL